MEICDLRETVTDQRSTIENQDKKILDLLENQKSGEKAEEYIQELVEEIHKEKEMVLEKDNEIQALLEKLDARRSQGDGEDSETKSKKVKIFLILFSSHYIVFNNAIRYRQLQGKFRTEFK